MSLDKECTIDPLLIAEFDKLFKDKIQDAKNSNLYCIGSKAIEFDNEMCLKEVIALLKAF